MRPIVSRSIFSWGHASVANEAMAINRQTSRSALLIRTAPQNKVKGESLIIQSGLGIEAGGLGGFRFRQDISVKLLWVGKSLFFRRGRCAGVRLRRAAFVARSGRLLLYVIPFVVYYDILHDERDAPIGGVQRIVRFA